MRRIVLRRQRAPSFSSLISRRGSGTATSMSGTPKPYDAEQVRRLGETTIAYYDRFARAFWEGTRHHDVSQNYAAFLNAIESDPPYSILDLGCGPCRELSD